ncbi:putative isomerase YbhE [Hypoxylon sp. NC0597]|nr:putative isomerase YbhE [Hypoxylon sp. NC0597]
MTGKGHSEVELKKLVLGTQDQILIINFNGTQFTIAGRYTKQDWNPCWMLFKEPNLLYAIDSTPQVGEISLFKLVPDFSSKVFFDKPVLVSSGKGSWGGAHIEFNADKTRIVGACYGSGMVDFWNVSATDGLPRIMSSSAVPGSTSPGRKRHRPHQAVLDPTGRFFIVPDLAGDKLLVVDDGKEIRPNIYSNVIDVPVGVGPRHVAFVTSPYGTHYLIMVAELSNEVFLYETYYTDDTIHLIEIDRRGAYGAWYPKDPSVAVVAELVVAKNQRDVYISNRFTGDKEDHISHFYFLGNLTFPRLKFIAITPTCGLSPRTFCLSKDEYQEFVFVGNEVGDSGLVAFKRDPVIGYIDPTPVATISNAELATPGIGEARANGPQFVSEI